jgi:hypothetical protein
MNTMDDTTLEALALFPRQLEAYYRAVPVGFEHWAPASWDGVPSEPFTAIEQVCHVRDVEIDGYHVRFQRTLHESDPLLPALPAGLAVQRDYAHADVADALASFASARAATITLLSGLGTEQLARTAVFEDYGPVTLRSLAHYLCSHDQQHLAGLQWLLGKIEALRV